MALKTPEQYEESLRKMNFKIYLMGELVKNWVDNPIIRPSMNSVKKTYELAQKPEYEDLMTATSHLTGNKVNRFTHLHQSTDDLIKKVKMQRLLGQQTASCFQRCVGMDAMNAVDSTTYEMDQKLGTKYHERFIKFLKMVQEEDLTLGTAAVGYRTESMHGAGSPQAQRIMIARQGNLEQKKKLAKNIAGIKEEKK
jgi:4-hydroxybutyryl-CoA dehydratase/vinylacetyl-CoA-Delta-isomerase